MKQNLLSALLFWCFTGVAQNPLVKQWDYRYGGTDDEFLYAIEQTVDDGYILAGYSNSDSIIGDKSQRPRGTIFLSGHYPNDYWMIKINAQGQKQWDKRFGGIAIDNLHDCKQTHDGGYILGGNSGVAISGDITQAPNGGSDFWVVKVDSFGNKQWDKQLGGPSGDAFETVVPTTDGGYLFGGTTTSDSGGMVSQHRFDTSSINYYKGDYWVIKTDSLGNKIWDKRFGGTSFDNLEAMVQTTDGGYMLGGYSYSDSSADKTQHSWDTITYSSLSYRGDFWVVKIDSIGNKQWDKRFGGLTNDRLEDLKQTADGGYILAGFSNSGATGDKTQPNADTCWSGHVDSIAYHFDLWLVKINAQGIKQWDKKFGGWDKEDDLGNVSQTLDGGYLIGATSYSKAATGDKSDNNLGTEQQWVIKTDSLGNKQWDKTILTATHDEICYAIQTRDGCYAMATYTQSGIAGDKTQPSWTTAGFQYDFWLTRFCDSSQHCNLASPVVTANQTIFCSGDSTEICATTSSVSYLWNTGQTTPCIYANHAGNYYITVADANNCSAVSNHLAVSVYPLPPVSISVNVDTLTSYNGVTYQWYYNGSPINNATDSVYITKAPGLYTVEITDANGCHTLSNPVNVVGTGIAAMVNRQFAVYPNPATTSITIIVDETLLGSKLFIYDITGRELMAAVLTTVNSQWSIVNYSEGIYFVTLENAKGRTKQKLAIQR